MKGILFRADSIKAIVEGRKTVTRRVIKPQPPNTAIMADSEDIKSRYQVGDVVYIKEAYWKDIDGSLFDYADAPRELIPDFCTLVSPLFMPEWAARYFIRIKDVRAERLQDILTTAKDVFLEGLPDEYAECAFGFALDWFKGLWDSIHKDYPWEANPWVFRYEFEPSYLTNERD
jgi:hypothetical protein